MCFAKKCISVSIALLCAAAPAASQNVTGVIKTGNVVRLTLSNGSGVSFQPINEHTLKVEYLQNNAAHRCSEIIDSALSSTLDFVGAVNVDADPVVLKGQGFTARITRNPFVIDFTDSAGTSLFKTSGISNSGLGAQVVAGNYYGFKPEPNSQLTLPSTAQTLYTPLQGRAHAPFVWTSKGFGILMDAELATVQLNNTAFTLGRGSSTNTNNLFFLMTGTPRQIMANYYRVTGRFTMPPLWAAGYLNSQWGMNQTTMLAYIKAYRAKDIPLDAFILDYDWFTHAGANDGDFKWNATNFPGGPTGALKKTCDSLGVKLVGIRKPRILGVELDFYQPAVQQNYWNKVKQYDTYGSGLLGYWNDEADYGGPLNFLFFNKCLYNGMRADYPNKRYWSLNRAYFGGANRYGYGLWSGDINTDWPTLANQRRFMLSAVNVGAAWWAMDIGGFQGTPTAEMYYRWMQFGAFVPIYRVHGTYGEEREPWLYGAQAEAIAKKFIQIRYSLIPYVYSAYYRLHRDGLPVVRPLVMDYPADAAVATDVNSYMFGENMLVAPVVTQGATSLSFYLPAGKWVSFWNDNDVVTGGKQITVPVTPEMIPVYVRQGAVIPRRPHGRCTGDSTVTSITFDVYGGAGGSFDYYEDDGASWAYETGGYCHIAYTHQSTDSYERLTASAKQGSYATAPKGCYVVFHNVAKMPLRVDIPGQNITDKAAADTNALKTAQAPAWFYDAAGKRVVIKTGDPFAEGVYEANWNTGVRYTLAGPARGFSPVRVQGRTLSLQLESPRNGSPVGVALYSGQGRLIGALHRGTMPAGFQRLTLPLGAVAAGCYYLRVTVDNKTVVHQTIGVFE